MEEIKIEKENIETQKEESIVKNTDSISYINTIRIIAISVCSTLFTLGAVFVFLFYYNTHFVSEFISGFIKTPTPNPTIVLNEKEDLDKNAITVPEEHKESVVDAVKVAKPAVVSVIASKEVPLYDVSFESIGGSIFQTPVYKQNGTKKQEVGSGSGFIIQSDGLIITNKHVVADLNATYEVLLNNGKKYDATVLARDAVYDVAFLKISANNLPYLSLADSDSIDVGQSVIAIGNALGEFKNTVSLGVVSGLSRSIVASTSDGGSEKLEKVIQTDAAINPGNSGGPLLNLRGEVIGINVATVVGSSSIGFAIPINSLKSSISSVRKVGKIVRPYVGIRYIDVNSVVKAKYNLSVDYGVLVQRGTNQNDVAVISGSPADKAGIIEGDVVLEVDGVKIGEDKDFAYAIRSKKIGDTIKMKILSSGVEKNISLKLAQAPDGM